MSLIYGDTNGDVQNPADHNCKLLRITDEGKIPEDNPFIGRATYKPEIYSLGHRNISGLAVHPGSGEMWAAEMGPSGGDEINILKPGANYGWPIVSLGRAYMGPWKSELFSKPGYENPVVFWMPSISVSGMTFYTGDKLPKWKGDLFVGGLRNAGVPGTGQLQRILFNEQMEVTWSTIL